MELWLAEITGIEEEIKELEIKLYHPHIIKSAEEDYDIKSQIIRKQTQIISIYLRETNRLIEKNHIK